MTSDMMEALKKLKKDIFTAEVTLSDTEARYIVDLYYQIQDYRKAIANQIRSMVNPTYFDENGKKRKPTEEEIENFIPEPHDNLYCFFQMFEEIENRIKSILNAYTDRHEMGQWLKSVTGIGPVISAGLVAHIDMEKCPTAGHIWSYAGLNPTAKWEKGKKRPWNASLKVLCWKIGQSFVKVSNNPNDVYGKLYKQRKVLEQQKNDNGEYKEQAKVKLETTNIGKDTDAYEWYSEGKLPPAHIQQRAERYATKIFLSHLHEVWYEKHFGKPAPAPYPIAILGHVHRIEI